MYTVYHERELMYTPMQIGSDAFVLIDPVLNLELNTAGTFTATVPACNSQYDKMRVLKSQIVIFDGTREDDNVLWQGRIISIVRDFWGNKRITAEGELAFFADYYEPSFERYGAAAERQDYIWKGTVQRFWELLIAHYNTAICNNDPFDPKYINGFEIDPVIAGKKIAIEQKSFTSGLDMIMNECVEQIGGYVWFEWSYSDSTRTRILHHSATSGEVLNQKIRFGDNMIDIEECIDGTAVYTALIAEGPNDDNGLPYTLRASDVPAADRANWSVNGFRLYYLPAVALFGKVEHYEKFDAAVNFADLYDQAKDKLSSALAESMTINVKAADLHYVDESKDKFKLGALIECISEPHGLDELFRMTALQIPLDKPEAEEYTLGLAQPAISVQANLNSAKVEKLEKNALTVKSSVKKAGATSGSSSHMGFINIGDELVLAYGYVGAKSVGKKADYEADYSAAMFRSTPVITAVPCCADQAGSVSGVGATLGTHIRSANSNKATIEITKTGGTNTVGVMWFAIGY